MGDHGREGAGSRVSGKGPRPLVVIPRSVLPAIELRPKNPDDQVERLGSWTGWRIRLLRQASKRTNGVLKVPSTREGLPAFDTELLNRTGLKNGVCCLSEG
jgi:hypothetical protein